MVRAIILLIAATYLCMSARAQDRPPSLYLNIPPEAKVKAPAATDIGPGLRKIVGTEPTQGITYSRIFLIGKRVPVATPKTRQAATAPVQEVEQSDATPPVLIAQCTKDTKSKLRFELLMNFGNVSDIAYYPPWKSSGPDDLFAPRTEKTDMTFDFFGYTTVKPVKRQWEWSLHVPVEARYNPPGAGSRNLEEITFYLQYLKALPTLRITHQSQAAQFDTTTWLAAVHTEPLCSASGV